MWRAPRKIRPSPWPPVTICLWRQDSVMEGALGSTSAQRWAPAGARPGLGFWDTQWLRESPCLQLLRFLWGRQTINMKTNQEDCFRLRWSATKKTNGSVIKSAWPLWGDSTWAQVMGSQPAAARSGGEISLAEDLQDVWHTRRPVQREEWRL